MKRLAPLVIGLAAVVFSASAHSPAEAPREESRLDQVDKK